MSGNSSQCGQGDDQGPPHPSACLPCVCLSGHTVGAHALSHCTPVRYGRIASVLTAHDVTQFGDSICPICVSTFQMLVHSDPIDEGLNRHRWGLPPWSSEYHTRPLPFLPIQYSSFSPNCPLLVSNYANHSIILLNHIGPPSIERALS
jgi:hypothetical protein